MTKYSVDQLLQQLAENADPISAPMVFLGDPGIYGFFLSKGCLRFGDREITAGRDVLLYIGKTESSQRARDARQHLADAGTGCSTLRRSLGALLLKKLELKPFPRSDSETSDRRFTNFKFDAEGERKLTKWMMENLKLGFKKFRDSDCEKLRVCEQALIKSAMPPLNILHNADGPYRRELLSARRECACLARGWPGSNTEWGENRRF
jgi:hypothetical protein